MSKNCWINLNKNDSTAGITPELSSQVNLLGSLLGEAIDENAKAETLNLVEQLRKLCKKAEKAQDIILLQQLAQQLSELPLEDIQWLLRIYTVFFNLVNQAEIQEMIRVNYQRQLQATVDEPRKESILAAIAMLKQQGYSLEDVLKLINQLDIIYTLTAHPTEARRQSVLQKHRDISQALQQLNMPHNIQQQSALIEKIRQYIILLLYTDNIRSENLTVADEVRNGLYFLRNSIWQTLPQVYWDLKFALKSYYDYDATHLPVIIRYHSWIGGDCDGNPFITPEVVAETLQRQQKAALKTCRSALWELRTELSLSDHKIAVDKTLQRSLQADAKIIKLDLSKTRHFSHEPYRVKINYMLEKIEAKLAMMTGGVSQKLKRIANSYQADNFIDDLLLIEKSLERSGLPYLAQASLLQNLILQAKTFGFHMAALDVRQHSEVHEAVVADILKKKNINKNYVQLSEAEKIELLHRLLLTEKNISTKNLRLNEVSKKTLQLFSVIKGADKGSIGSYIISMTHQLSDVLEVLLLAKITGIWRYQNKRVVCDINVVPLFETVDDLSRITDLLTAMYNDKVYKKQIKARHNVQESMLGYSDSNKDGGYWAANYLLYEAQENIANISRQYGIDFRMFHGRGGSAGRGGGRLYQSILAMPTDCQNGRMRVTEQGEVITFHYELEAMTHRHYEQTIYAMLIATARANSSKPSSQFVVKDHHLQIMKQLAETSLTHYRSLIHHNDFWQWYIHFTPIEFISKLPIASRPVSRKAASEVDFNNLRAIPWVFSWTQVRYNVPGWFGIGFALKTLLENHPAALEELQQLYRDWPFFRLIMNNTQQEMARAHFLIAEFYHVFSEIKSIIPILKTDFELAKQYILQITEQEKLLDNNLVLQKSIVLRNPYTDVLNLLQVDAIQRWYSMGNKNKKDKEKLTRIILLSINGLAAAMQTTG